MAKALQYPVNKSPFYRLRNKAKLANLLQLPKTELLQLVKHPTYNSGKSGISHIDNATFHSQNDFFLTLDIERFYPSSKAEYVFRFFRYVMLMSDDVAGLMAKLVTYEGHIPTGSSLSQSIAYHSYSKMFDSLNELAHSKGLTFSLYVDDMVFSSSMPIEKPFKAEIMRKLRTVELALKLAKVRFGSPKDFKVVTGVAITPNNEMAIPNKLRKKIAEQLKQGHDIGLLSDRKVKTLSGRVEAARRIEPTSYDSLRRALSPRLEIIRAKQRARQGVSRRRRKM
ncbi:MAG: reverse transcriptase family protein [Ignavibacteriales bacterium]|nr:reverse transcriptase family protein [Ignavibacteriales bacterium]